MPRTFLLEFFIGFVQEQYIIYDWINSSLNICLTLINGPLQQNVTVIVGTTTNIKTSGKQLHQVYQ